MWRNSFEAVRNIELCRTLWAYVRRSTQIPRQQADCLRSSHLHSRSKHLDLRQFLFQRLLRQTLRTFFVLWRRFRSHHENLQQMLWVRHLHFLLRQRTAGLHQYPVQRRNLHEMRRQWLLLPGWKTQALLLHLRSLQYLLRKGLS